MAKVQYQLCNYAAAEQRLQTILRCAAFKDSYEALRLLAQIKALQSRQTNSNQEALRLFRRVIELNPRDFSANFEVAFLFE